MSASLDLARLGLGVEGAVDTGANSGSRRPSWIGSDDDGPICITVHARATISTA